MACSWWDFRVVAPPSRHRTPLLLLLSTAEQHAEAQKEKKKKAAEEKKRIAAGVWERHYTNDGGKFWQHSVTGKKVSQDPFR